MKTFDFIKKLFSLNKTEFIDPMKKYLIVGLGNPGEKYKNTRHNIGFKALDYIAENENLSFETQKLGDITSFRFKGRKFILLKPNTFMNLSGKAVKYWMQKEKIPLENILVISDDLNLPFGALRLKPKGSDGGHNGLKDINIQLNTNQYARIRFGVGDAFSKGRQVDYVLGQWNEKEIKSIPEKLDRIHKAVKSFGTAGVGNTMNNINTKK
jgi:PTH1 family peptidyl-tRNA hydrolase